MVSMRQKLKDVETTSYMLAIYKDNEHGHLIRHAIKYWLARKPEYNQRNYAGPQYNNPLVYCPYPPMDLVEHYFNNSSAMSLLNSRLLRCPIVARWAFEKEFETLAQLIQAQDDLGWYVSQVIDLIEFDEELIYRIVTSPIGPKMPSKFIEMLNDEQRATLAICA